YSTPKHNLAVDVEGGGLFVAWRADAEQLHIEGSLALEGRRTGSNCAAIHDQIETLVTGHGSCGAGSRGTAPLRVYLQLLSRELRRTGWPRRSRAALSGVSMSSPLSLARLRERSRRHGDGFSRRNLRLRNEPIRTSRR